MHTISGTVRGVRRLAQAPELSRQARQRLKWMDYYQEHGNACLTCRHFDISPQTLRYTQGQALLPVERPV